MLLAVLATSIAFWAVVLAGGGTGNGRSLKRHIAMPQAVTPATHDDLAKLVRAAGSSRDAPVAEGKWSP